VRRFCTVAFVLAAVLGCTACTSEEVLRVGGQTLYNSGRYLCTQSAQCDAGDSGNTPPASSNRR